MESSISSAPTVILARQTSPEVNQRVIGKRTHTSGELDDFRAIPFGSIPARWKHSHVRTNLPSDTFYAIKDGPKCPQLSEPNNSEGGFNASIPFPSDVTESKFDCLNLFVVRPSREALIQRGHNPETPLLVFTWVHGGAYGFGACADPISIKSCLGGSESGLNLGKPFIAVYLNYRAGIFGFAATSAMIEAQNSDEIKGVNFGLRDQKVGFRWIANNILAFSGDPQRITIAGQSAGGSSTHVHALEAKTNPSTPLFQKAIVQSGAVGCSGSVSLADAEASWDRLCKVLGVSADDKKSLTLDFTVDLDPVLVNLGETSSVKPLSGSSPQIEVQLGEVDNEGSLYQRQAESIASFERVKEPFYSSNIDPQIVQFGFPISKAYEYFSSQNHNEKPRPRKTIARRYKVNFGNPFSDGPSNNLYGVSHHCVDMIYMFNVFPNQLIQADLRLKPSEATNELLRQSVQKDWNDFITSDGGQDVDQGVVVRYDEDRVTRLVKASEDNFFKQQEVRYAFLSKHMPEMRKLVNAFTGMPVF
ncbi:uncharacterized protein PAC_13837 [Phialocephala subalpina]|uniref:Carboxylesterase type B domain-containing protein n=1 Tax=Phialocephala subalpina TaxID=576137 RepID=A0A1L7XFX5_9HELO|nr:uncharacterized protein PAC_13837 [Phialocephala subalpina]